MRVPGRSRLSPRETGILFGGGLVCSIVLGALIAANTRWSAAIPGGGGFFSVWAAGREFLLHHGDPYSAGAAAQAQLLAYGAAAHARQNPLRLDLPFFLMPLSFPLDLIRDPNLARGVWTTLAQMALVAATLMCVRLIDWEPSRASLFLISLMALLSYPAVTALVDGTLAIMLLLIYVAVLRCLQTGNDELAGALAVLALFKWEIGAAFLLLVTLHIVQERRWRVVAGFGMALTILLALAFLVYPGWFTPFLVGTVAMVRSGHGVSTESALLELFPKATSKLALVLTGLTLSLLLVEGFGVRSLSSRRFTWTACLALAASPLLGLRSELPSLVMLVPGLIMIAAGGSQRRPYGQWTSVFVLALLFGAPWIVASKLLVLPTARGEALIFLLLPLMCLIGMYWTRWWFLRPARTWMDEIREAR